MITIILRIIRTKVLAVLLGPTGVGLIGIYDSITGLTGSVSGMGIGSSGIRQIAAAVGSGDYDKISRTIICLRRVALFSGIIGLCLLFSLSGPVSILTFGNLDHAHDISLLSITILFAAVSGGQMALIQGMRQIKELAKLSILGALLGTVLSIPLVYFFGVRGVVFYLIIVSAMGVLTSWLYSRKIRTIRVPIGWRATVTEAKPLLKLGFVFMLTALMTSGTLYLLRVFVIRYLGLTAAGIYQAAATLSTLYVGFILDAMGRDFYPQLTAISQDNTACTSLVNQQMEIGLLLAAPGIIATMTLAPFVIKIFYSAEFVFAVDILRWQILGIMLQVVTWPMGFILLAKGNGKLFFWTECFANCIQLLLVWLGIKNFGLPGAGMAFFGMYIFYIILIFAIVRSYYAFVLSRENRRTISIVALAAGVAFINPYFFAHNVSLLVNFGITVVVCIYRIE